MSGLSDDTISGSFETKIVDSELYEKLIDPFRIREWPQPAAWVKAKDIGAQYDATVAQVVEAWERSGYPTEERDGEWWVQMWFRSEVVSE